MKLLFVLTLTICLNIWVHGVSSAPLYVGFIYNREPTDFAWNFQLDLARVSVWDTYGRDRMQTKYVVAKDDAGRFAAASQLYDWGSRLMFVSSNEENFSLVYIASSFPDVKFIITSGNPWGENVNQILVRDFQAYYVGGYLMGLMSKVGMAGFLAPARSVESYRAMNAFSLGAREANPKFQVNVYFVGTDLSYDKTRKATEWLIQSGHDAVVGYRINPVIYETTRTSRTWTMSFPISFGRVIYGSHVLLGVSINWINAFTDAIERNLNGTWDTNYVNYYGTTEGGVVFGSFSWDVPDDVAKAADVKRKYFTTVRKCVFWKPSLDSLNLTLFNASYGDDGCLQQDGYYSIDYAFEQVQDLGDATDENVYSPIYVYDDSGSAIAIYVIVGITDLVVIFFIIAVYIFRKRVIIAATNEFFCYAILFGSLMGYTSLFFWIGEPTGSKCQMRIWFLTLGASIIFGAIASKTYRIWRIWYNPDLKEAQRSWKIVGMFIGCLLSIEVVLLIILTALEGYYVTRNYDVSDLDYDKYYLTCELSKAGNILLGLILGVNGLVILVCSVLAYISKNVSQRYNETTSIILSIYSVIVSAAVVILLFVNTKTNNTLTRLTYIACGVYITITCPLLSIFLPKFKTIFTEYSNGSTPSTNIKHGSMSTQSDTNGRRTTEPH